VCAVRSPSHFYPSANGVWCGEVVRDGAGWGNLIRIVLDSFFVTRVASDVLGENWCVRMSCVVHGVANKEKMGAEVVFLCSQKACIY